MQNNIKKDPIQRYLAKQGKQHSLFSAISSQHLKLTVVIPAYKETNISETLSSLLECDKVDFDIEILIYVNGSINDSFEDQKINKTCAKQVELFAQLHSTAEMQILLHSNLHLALKKAGVGQARKLLMDEALFRFAKIDNPEGIIVNLDADCMVSKNYFKEIYNSFQDNELAACSIHFEHRVDSPLTLEAIVNYELHLRYFIGMQKLIALPFAYQTIGSAMAVRALSYARQGGMNTRKAGEDFYFLHKFIKNDNCFELNSATVYPSGRVSDRVPFGTGRAVGEMLNGKPSQTYNPASFKLLSEFLQGLELIYQNERFDLTEALDPCLRDYFEQLGLSAKLREIKDNTTNYQKFRKRFFQYFDAFQFMKYLHYMRDNGKQDIKLSNAITYYFLELGLQESNSMEGNLKILRAYDVSL